MNFSSIPFIGNLTEILDPGGGSIALLGAALSPDSEWGTTIAVSLPSGMVDGCRLVVILGNFGAALSSFSTGTWENITPVGGIGDNASIWISAPFVTPPADLTVTFAGDSIHNCRCFAMSIDNTDADPVISEGSGSTGYDTVSRPHPYDTTQANSIIIGGLSFGGGGVTGGTPDAFHTWLGTSSAYGIAFGILRETAGSYSADIAPTGAGSGSGYWFVEIGAA